MVVMTELKKFMNEAAAMSRASLNLVASNTEFQLPTGGGDSAYDE